MLSSLNNSQSTYPMDLDIDDDYNNDNSDMDLDIDHNNTTDQQLDQDSTQILKTIVDSYSIINNCAGNIIPLVSVYSPDQPKTSFTNVFTQENLNELFELCNNRFTEQVVDTGSVIRFLNIYITRNNVGELEVALARVSDQELSDLSSSGHSNFINQSLTPDEFKNSAAGEKAYNLFIIYIRYIIYHSTLKIPIENALPVVDSDTPSNQRKIIRISLDFYRNRLRPANTAEFGTGFHKDSFGPNYVNYVNLTYKSVSEITGPELIAAVPATSQSIGPEPTLLVRPKIPVSGTVGFNDNYFLHSSPDDQTPNLASGRGMMLNCNQLVKDRFGYETCHIVDYTQPRNIVSQESRDFIRLWWHVSNQQITPIPSYDLLHEPELLFGDRYSQYINNVSNETKVITLSANPVHGDIGIVKEFNNTIYKFKLCPNPNLRNIFSGGLVSFTNKFKSKTKKRFTSKKKVKIKNTTKSKLKSMLNKKKTIKRYKKKKLSHRKFN